MIPYIFALVAVALSVALGWWIRGQMDRIDTAERERSDNAAWTDCYHHLNALRAELDLIEKRQNEISKRDGADWWKEEL